MEPTWPPEIVEPEMEPQSSVPNTENRDKLGQTRQMWMSDDQEEDILHRFLKVQDVKDMRIPSFDSKTHISILL